MISTGQFKRWPRAWHVENKINLFCNDNSPKYLLLLTIFSLFLNLWALITDILRLREKKCQILKKPHSIDFLCASEENNLEFLNSEQCSIKIDLIGWVSLCRKQMQNFGDGLLLLLLLLLLFFLWTFIATEKISRSLLAVELLLLNSVV